MTKDLLHSASQGGYKYDPRFGKDSQEFNLPYKRSDTRRGGVIKKIFILRDQIMHDVEMQTTIISRTRKNDNLVDKNLLTDTEMYKSMFDRWFDKHFNLAKARLSAYTIEDEKINEIDGLNQENLNTITLFMPLSWNETAFPRLKQAIHDYIATAVLYEFLSITMTISDPVVIGRKNERDIAYDDIRNAANTVKAGAIHKPLSPFPY